MNWEVGGIQEWRARKKKDCVGKESSSRSLLMHKDPLPFLFLLFFSPHLEGDSDTRGREKEKERRSE